MTGMQCRIALLELARSPPELGIPHVVMHLSLDWVGSGAQVPWARMMAIQPQMAM